MKVRVKCTVFVEVDVPDDIDAKFYIEENGCPGTSAVGAAIDKAIRECDAQGICWACKLGGENEIVAIAPTDRRRHGGPS